MEFNMKSMDLKSPFGEESEEQLFPISITITDRD
jgi:hypothetical protein